MPTTTVEQLNTMFPGTKWLLSFAAASKVIGMDVDSLRTAARRKNDPLPTYLPPDAVNPKVNMLLVPAWLERNSVGS